LNLERKADFNPAKYRLHQKLIVEPRDGFFSTRPPMAPGGGLQLSFTFSAESKEGGPDLVVASARVGSIHAPQSPELMIAFLSVFQFSPYCASVYRMRLSPLVAADHAESGFG